jgi:hypothetical protein
VNEKKVPRKEKLVRFLGRNKKAGLPLVIRLDPRPMTVHLHPI